MKDLLLYPIGTTEACRFAASFLEKSGISLLDHPAPEVTHILLDIPSFSSDGALRGGGQIEDVLERLPKSVTVIGGYLHHPYLTDYQTFDLLQDETYLSKNAAITADCALRVASPLLPVSFSDLPVLILGWGRIGKCLGFLLRSLGASVTVAVRSHKDRGILSALGFRSVDLQEAKSDLSHFRLIFNTVPALILKQDDLKTCQMCTKIDLASHKGMEGDDIIWARNLPGIHTPETSGQLIANTFLSHCKEAFK